MSKLYIDGKLVDCSPQAKALVDKVSSALGGAPLFAPPSEYPETFAACEAIAEDLKHASGECVLWPTYFCPRCAREAMRGVDLADPWQ